MAKKIFDTQTGIPKQEALDMSMFDKKELDLSMFEKEEESVSPEPVSQSSGANVDPQELRYTDYKLKLGNLSIDKPKPFGISDDMNINLMDIAAKAEASKPVKNQFSDYALGVPAELNDIVGNTFEWIGKRTQDIDQVLGGVPGYLISKFSPGNPEAQARASLQEQYLKEKDPQKKAALGEQINVFREEQNPFLQVSKIYKNAASNLPSLPENIAGQAIKGAVDAAPLILSLAYTPEITLPEILGTSFKIPKFTTLEAVKGFYKGATKEGSVKDKIKNSLVETAYGAGTGTFLHGLGVTSQQLGSLVGEATKSGLLKGTTAALANGLGFSAYDAGSQFYQTGEIDPKQMISSGITGAVLGIPEIASVAYEKAVSKFMSSPIQTVEAVNSMNIDPVSLRNESNRLGELSKSATGDQRNDIISNKKIVDSILDIYAASLDVVKNPDVYHEMINKSDIPDIRKRELNDKIDLVVSKDKESQSITDANIIKSRDNIEFKEPELFISDETKSVFESIDLNEPITNKRLSEASSNLYQEYNRLETVKHSHNRINTVEEIQSAQDFLEKNIISLEDQINVQRERGMFINFRSRGQNKPLDEINNKSEVKVPPKENNAPTSLLERPQHEIQYEEAMSKKSQEVIDKMPSFNGKKFSLATIKPNGDISNVYVRSEGQSYKTYMTPEDAKAYEEGSISLGYWSPESKTFLEAPQKGKEFGQQVMNKAASKVETPNIKENASTQQRVELQDVFDRIENMGDKLNYEDVISRLIKEKLIERGC